MKNYKFFICYMMAICFTQISKAQICVQTLSGTISGSFNNKYYCITGDITINGTVDFTDAEFSIEPNVKINVLKGATLSIKGSHLYSNKEMWGGIEVFGGTVSILNGITHDNSLIEDADIALKITDSKYALGNYTTTIDVQNTIFNRNRIGIEHDY